MVDSPHQSTLITNDQGTVIQITEDAVSSVDRTLDTSEEWDRLLESLDSMEPIDPFWQTAPPEPIDPFSA